MRGRPEGRAAPLLLALLLLSGCNVIRLQQARMVGQLREAGLTSGDAELGDDEVHFWSRDGEGTPVLLLHGFGTPAVWQWGLQVPALGERPLVLPDLLGFGGSRSTRRVVSIDDQVRALVALLDELGHERVDVVGISYGGLVAYELATAHPERVRRMVLVDSPGRAYTRADHRALLSRFGVDHIGEVFVPRTDADVRGLLELSYASPPFAPDLVLGQIREVFYARRPRLLGLLDALVRDIDRLRARPDPEVDTLLIWGRDDPVFPLPIARRLQRRLGPETRLEVIDEARHGPNVEHPERFNAIVREFLGFP